MENRQIRFRAWENENKRWIDDTDIAINQKWLFFIRHQYQTDFVSISLKKSANYILVFYTGLKDKNGKEIFEGDIVKQGGTIGKIIFKQCCFYIEWVLIKEEWSEFLEHHNKDSEIIGNIYQHRELLEGK